MRRKPRRNEVKKMAKKIRFPLEMKDGIEVRDLEGLKENFSIERILFYLADGKLETWLRDRYLDELADAVAGLDKEDEELDRKLCEIFEVEYAQEEEADMEKAMERMRKMELLKKFTDEEKYFDVIDYIAFDQDDMYNLLDEGETAIYLCGDKFPVPLGKRGINYIGINHPTVVISSKEKVDFEGKGISFENVQFDEKYQKIVDGAGPKTETGLLKQDASPLKYGSYCSNTYLDAMMVPKEREEAKSCYEKICALMEGLDGNVNIKRIWADLDRMYLIKRNSTAYDEDNIIFLATLFNYDKLNDCGKKIMELVSDLEKNEGYLPSYKDIKYKIEQAEWIIGCIHLGLNNLYREYIFIFWALMILAVDGADKEEHLSLICDFAKLLHIKDTKMMDIVQIVRLVFGKETEGFLASAAIRICFEKLLNDFGFKEKPISSIGEGLSRICLLGQGAT